MPPDFSNTLRGLEGVRKIRLLYGKPPPAGSPLKRGNRFFSISSPCLQGNRFFSIGSPCLQGEPKGGDTCPYVVIGVGAHLRFMDEHSAKTIFRTPLGGLGRVFEKSPSSQCEWETCACARLVSSFVGGTPTLR